LLPAKAHTGTRKKKTALRKIEDVITMPNRSGHHRAVVAFLQERFPVVRRGNFAPPATRFAIVFREADPPDQCQDGTRCNAKWGFPLNLETSGCCHRRSRIRAVAIEVSVVS